VLSLFVVLAFSYIMGKSLVAGRQYLLSLQVFVSGKTQHICFLCLKCKSESSDMMSCT
jgi:hypothetical protein